MSCITYINNDPSGLPVTVSGRTCMQVYTAVTLNYGQAICMDNEYEIITCGNADIGAPCINPIPPSATPTPTITPTPTCPVYTLQYLEVVLQSCHNFKLTLWNNPNFTGSANAVCDVVVSGCAYGNMGTVYCGTETILATQHQHNFSLQSILQPGECVSSFSVLSAIPACNCYDVTFVPPTPTPTPTPSITPTNTPTPTNTATNTPSVTLTNTPTNTETPTPTPSNTEGLTPTPTNTPTTTATPTPTICNCTEYQLTNLDFAEPTAYSYTSCQGAFVSGSLAALESTIVCAETGTVSFASDIQTLGYCCGQPEPSPSSTPTLTPTPTVTPSVETTSTPTPTLTPTPTETNVGGTLNVYARYVNTSQEFGYTINTGPYLAIGEPTSSNCLFAGTITGLQNGDLVSFVTLFTCGINGDTADCPNSVGSCLWNYTFNGSTTVYITVDGSQCC